MQIVERLRALQTALQTSPLFAESEVTRTLTLILAPTPALTHITHALSDAHTHASHPSLTHVPRPTAQSDPVAMPSLLRPPQP